MKTLLASAAILAALRLFAFGIPQTFIAPNQFLTSAGVSFEQFAADPAAWTDAAALKGHWQAHGDTLTLTESAAVFGVTADEITARQQDGHVQSFRVVFRKHANSKSKDLLGQVTAGVKVFTGEAGTSAHGGETVFKFKGMTITLRSSAGNEVVAEFSRS